ncbi:MAG: tetratricopeptide repeat protein, partial [Pedobacter sp.]
MKNTINNIFKATLFFSVLCIAMSCSTQKNTAVNRKLQNLSARYNYIYNSNIILQEYENGLSQTLVNSYDQLLPVYLTPAATADSANRSLTEILSKAQIIIAEKNVSNYIDDAYMLMGKANFYQSNYFTATEYFDYVAKTYSVNKPVFVTALTWKARSQFMLNNVKEARLILDTVELTIPLLKKKKNKAEVYATLAQLEIIEENYNEAADLLKLALKQQHTQQEGSRWEYILGQLYEQTKNYDESLNYFKKVVNSNAPFEMYFNANLNRIKINGLMNGTRLNRQQQILALLRDDKNEEYTDQIYYRVAETYAEKGDVENARKYYLLSLTSSTRNQYQKGLSYLRMADLNFLKLGDYLTAKKYYDSAVTTLPVTYPGYNAIVKKSANLEYLSTRYRAIAYQDTLQMIARLPEAGREARILQVLGPEVQLQAANQPAQTPQLLSTNLNDPFGTEPAVNSTFYFSSLSATSNGYNDFKRKWGNRQLEDNWRQSSRSSAQTIAQNQNIAAGTADSSGVIPSYATQRKAEVIKYLNDLPLNKQLLAGSDQKIIDNYLEIASFYQQELNDNEEAARIYELILERYPQNKNLDIIFYSLYRAYLGNDDKNASRYKDLVLKNFPNSVYARTITDPSYTIRENAAELQAQKNYNAVYNNYEKKDFGSVITQVNTTLASSQAVSLRSQYDYLKAIAIGRTNNVDSLLTAFSSILSRYPDDQLITPLVKDHITYINAHLSDFKKRKIALIDFDPNEPRFNAQNVTGNNYTQPVQPQNNIPQTVNPQVPTPASTNTVPVPAIPVITNNPKPEIPGIKTDGVFTNAASTIYYYVVNVSDVSLTLSSSRFGIGQFNRGNYPDNNLRHQLNELDDDQMIYVGNFPNLESVKRYAEVISSQLKNIMKVPASVYAS